MRSLVFASFVAALSFLQAPTTKPDFSGTWTMDRSRSQSPDVVTLQITQTPTEIAIETTKAGTSTKRIYRFESTPHPATEAVTAEHSHAYWRESQLITETSGDIQGQTVSFKQTRSLNATGTEMAVESLTIVQHGYSLVGGQNYSTAKDVYVKKAP
jgi:hypothetical protein